MASNGSSSLFLCEDLGLPDSLRQPLAANKKLAELKLGTLIS